MFKKMLTELAAIAFVGRDRLNEELEDELDGQRQALEQQFTDHTCRD